MDYQKVCKYARTVGLVFLILLIPASPAWADGELVVVTQMPVPVPVMPAIVPAITSDDLPIFESLPAAAVTADSLPSAVSSIQAAGNAVNSVMSDVQEQMTSALADASEKMGKTRSTINGVRARIGSPLSDVQVSDNSIDYTAYSVATNMANSIQTSTAYLRGLSRLGGVGLDLTFVLLGLGWLVVVNLLDMLIRIGLVIVKVVMNVVGAIVNLINVISNVINAVMEIIDIITGPFT